jgi:hypothetical protein
MLVVSFNLHTYFNCLNLSNLYTQLETSEMNKLIKM